MEKHEQARGRISGELRNYLDPPGGVGGMEFRNSGESATIATPG